MADEQPKPDGAKGKKMGRPTKFDQDRIDGLLEALRAGNFLKPACLYAGIDYQTFRNWMNKGEAAKSGEYFDFFTQVHAAVAHAEVRAVTVINVGMANNPKLALDFLRYRHASRWRGGEDIEITGPDGGPLTSQVIIVELPNNGRD